jgi:hypothetical protein
MYAWQGKTCVVSSHTFPPADHCTDGVRAYTLTSRREKLKQLDRPA